MTNTEFSVVLVLYAVLAVSIVASSVLCFRRTRAIGFVFLAATLVLWPWIDGALDLLLSHFVYQVAQGQTPWLFPFSLMVSGDGGWTGWHMSPGEFVTKFTHAKEIMYFLLLSISFMLVARSVSRKPSTDAR